MSTKADQAVMEKVVKEFEEIFKSKGLTPPALVPGTVLDGSLGLESLDFAELVIRLEQVFGIDPFAQEVLPDVRTLADLCILYEPAT